MSTAKILVVDDDASVNFFLEEILTRDGYQVTTAESGEVALEHIAARRFDLVLLDLKMEGIGGIEVLNVLRQRWPDVVVIVLTGHGSLETAVEALRHGAHDYLFKPCRADELRQSVRKGLLKRRQDLRRRELLAELERSLVNHLEGLRAVTGEEPLPPVERGDALSTQRDRVRVDVRRRMIYVDDRPLELSPTEFDLLAYLVREMPRVVSPQELIREVHGHESEPWEARDIVRSHIYHIRRKVRESTGYDDLIRTVRGVGYTIGEEYIRADTVE